MDSFDGNIILNEFGQKLTKTCLDSAFYKPRKVDFHHIIEYMNTLSPKDKIFVKNYLTSMTRTLMPSLMEAFVESGKYSDEWLLDIKFIDSTSKSHSLKELSDNLVAEPVLDNGWLDNYSSVYREGYIFHLKD